jgi:hypothetical protein
VALEYDNSDVISLTSSRYLIETEVKLNIPDLKRDIKKPKHFRFREHLGLDTSMQYPEWAGLKRSRQLYPSIESLRRLRIHEFWFAIPGKIADSAVEVVEELYPYAGVFVGEVYGKQQYPFLDVGLRKGGVRILRSSKKFRSAERLKLREVVDIVKGQSATLTRLALSNSLGK